MRSTKKKRFLAGLLAAALLCTSLPFTSFAEEEKTASEAQNLENTPTQAESPAPSTEPAPAEPAVESTETAPEPEAPVEKIPLEYLYESADPSVEITEEMKKELEKALPERNPDGYDVGDKIQIYEKKSSSSKKFEVITTGEKDYKWSLEKTEPELMTEKTDDPKDSWSTITHYFYQINGEKNPNQLKLFWKPVEVFHLDLNFKSLDGELPDEVKNTLPKETKQENEYYEKDKKYTPKTFKDIIIRENGQGVTWHFEGWKVDGEGDYLDPKTSLTFEDKAINLVGYWSKKSSYSATFKFESATEGKELPSYILEKTLKALMV